MPGYRNPDLARYDNPDPIVEVGDRGQKADPQLLNSRRRIPEQTITVTPRVSTLVGFGLSATHVITGTDGLIVVDTGAGIDEAKRKIPYIEALSPLPIRAFIYTHFHYAAGTAALLPADGDYEIYAHSRCDRNHANAVSGTAGIKKMRVAAQAGHALPAEGADADSAGTVVSKAGEHGYVAPTRPVERNGQELTIRGVRFVFYTEYPFDTDCTLLLWLPEEKTVIHNHLTGNFPNVYSIGGGPFRDPRPWIAGLDKIRALAPEQLLGCHGLPFAGRAHVTEVVTVTRDALQFVYDQTVRAMNRGLSPREAVDLVKLPESLADHPALSQTYGEVWHHVRSVYEGLIGWYDGDAANLVPLDPALESLRIVEGFGGPQAALDNARQALARGETGWATRLASHVRRTTASGEYVREAALLEAAALRRAAWITPAWGTRNACLTQARELEGHPGRESLQQAPTLSMLMESPPSATIGFLRSRLVPERVDAGEHYLVLILSDASYNLILRNGVLDATHRPTADTTGSAGDSAEPRELRIDRSDLLHYLLNGVGGDKLPPYARRFFDHFELPWTTADPAERLPWKRQPNSRS